MELFPQIKWTKQSSSAINFIKLPVTSFDPLKDGIEECNELVKYLESVAEYKKFDRTKSGGIAKSIFNALNGMEFQVGRSWIELLIHIDGSWARVQFRSCKDLNGEKEEVWGNTSLKQLIKICPEIKEFVSKDEEKNEEKHIEAKKYYNNAICPIAFMGIPERAENVKGKELVDCVCSIDIHSAFPAALARVIPRIRERINEMYNKRKDDPNIKQVLNLSIGTMTSTGTQRYLGAKRALAGLRLDVLDDHAHLMNFLVKEIEKQGGVVINLRTDSIKFIWLKPFKPVLPGEGNGLGQWSYEFYKTPKYRQFSTGCYEYIDNAGAYHPVLNGYTSLDRIKPRSEWEWGDIKNSGKVITWSFDIINRRFV